MTERQDKRHWKERRKPGVKWDFGKDHGRNDGGGSFPGNDSILMGWQPTCSCDNEGKGRCLVLDPFAGSGTTGEVALKHGRDYLLIELNRDYEKLIRGRLGLFYEEAEAVRVN